MKKTFTIVEMVIVSMVLTVLLMGALAYNHAAGMFYRGINRNVQLTNEMYYILDHMQRTISAGAMGSPGDSAFTLVNNVFVDFGVQIRLPEEAGGVRDPALDNLNLGDNPTCTYVFRYGPGAGQYHFDFVDNAGVTVDTLSERMVMLVIHNTASAAAASLPPVPENAIRIETLSLRFDPTKPIEKDENPQVDLPVPITITSLAHSAAL